MNVKNIKFKAKGIIGDKWLYGSLVKSPSGTYIEWYADSICNREEVNRTTVCLFTGFHDKNGKEIYEGDVLRSDIYPFSCLQDEKRDNYFGVVFYDERTAAFGIMSAKNPESSVRGISDGICDYITQDYLQDFEVVGNIHDDEWKQYAEYF